MPEYRVTYADGTTNNIRALESHVKELTKDGGSYDQIVVTKTDGQVRGDYIVPLTDHPQRDAYMTYRQSLRDWPSTSNFPDTKPTVG